MTTSEIRSRFLEFFAAREHLVVPSASLVPFEDDPSVLLTIAGMQPLKSYFMGSAAPPAARMASSQKCFRTNDIDEVGHTARHLTFFEMLGNFSIGDYFKPEAIRFAFDLSTEVFGLDPGQIWITVFEGMEGVPADDDAVELWVALGVPRDRIQALGEADNFWKAGPTGPCGPNTELYLDRGPAFGPPGGPATGTDRFLEFWNLVFMQYERRPDGDLAPLPAKNIDTGAGLERIAALLQDVPSVFDTDGFRPLIEWVEGRSGITYGGGPRTDRALRVLADHGRAMSFLAADGVRPGNEGRGYVLRRIIRRAVSEAARLDLEPQEIVSLAEVVAGRFGDAYPELVARGAEIADVLGAEAEQFARTLSQGQRRLAEVIAMSAASRRIAGDDAFRLFDTYGFPLDLTVDAAAEAGLVVDTEGFDALMGEQRERSRRGAGPAAAGEDLIGALAAAGVATRFTGYEALAVDTEVTAAGPAGDPDRLLIKLADSPFYAEGGGQVSDSGWIDGPDGQARVTAVHRRGDDQVIEVAVSGRLGVGDRVSARVDAVARRATQANHTATHLLHWALQERLGTGARQAGSYVGPDKLRFDFSHRGKVDPAELARIEALVSARVTADDPVVTEVMAREEAAARGATGLFEEKYGERVRVVQTGDYSKELCGGTHVGHTGEIAAFKIVSESSIGVGARRVEALTGSAVVDWYRRREDELLADVASRDERIAELEREVRAARRGRVDVAGLVSGAQALGDLRIVVDEVASDDMNELLALSARLRGELGDGAVVVLGARADGKAMLVANLAGAAIAAGLSAADLIREVAPLVGGGGGGKPDMARAGGKEPERLPAALAAAGESIRARLA